MKVKIFLRGLETKKLDQISVLEGEINEWLAENPSIKIVDIKMSSNGGSLKVIDTKLFISVWYEEG